MAPQTIAHYQILEKLGEGGMGVVYRATDVNLHRDVALKVLPEGALSSQTARAMFRREALALGRLNHPNIETVYEFDTSDGVDYLVTEYVPGATLAQAARDHPLADSEVRRLGLQIAAALRAAHEKGVVHCDLKPANVILTPENNVKLLDFGLARILHPAASACDATTQTMYVAGTVPYMAPEQLRGDPPDARFDIYAVGALLYELATGRRPFPDAQQAALIDAILHQKPESPRSLQPALSAGLEKAILKCLEKEPDRRYASAADLARALDSSAPAAVPAKHSAGTRALALIGVILFAAGIAAVWLMGARPVLSFAPRDWILIADFENQTGDPLFDKSLFTALEVSLEQSRVLNVLPRSRARDTLRRMRKTGNEPIDEVLAKEIAARESIKVVLLPSISGIGGAFRLAGRIREVATDRDVKTRIVGAKNREDVLAALDKLAAGLRKDLGESLLAISSNNRPLEEVTTHSLEALRQFSMAIERHKATDFAEARLYYDQALKTDPQFTAARSALGMLLFERFDRKEGARLLDQTLADLDRLTARERYGIQAFHAAAVEQNFEKAAGIDKALLALYPDDSATHNNLGIVYVRSKRYREAVAEFREALRIDPHFLLALTNLSYWALFGLGDLDAVIDACKDPLQLCDQDQWLLANLGWAYLGKARLPDAEGVFRRSAGLFPKFFLNRYRLGMALRFQHRWEEALNTFGAITDVDKSQCFAYYETAMTRDFMGAGQLARREFARAQTCLKGFVGAKSSDASTQMLLALVLTHLGQHAAAAEAEQKGLALNPDLPVEEAAILAAGGRTEAAVDRLATAVQKGYSNLVWIQTHAEFQRLKSIPRFEALLRSHLQGLGDLP